MTPKRAEQQWRHRNPDLAARFDKLPKRDQARIREHFAAPTARGVSKNVRTAVAERQERKREADARYRARVAVRKRVARYKALSSHERSVERDVMDEERMFWELYDGQPGDDGY